MSHIPASPDVAADPAAPAWPWIGWARDVSAAAVVCLAAVSFYISAASLLFQGELAPQLPHAIGACLLGAGILAMLAAWRGALRLASVGPEPATVPVLAALTAAIAAHVSGPALLPTAVMALTLTGLAIGGAWWLIGRCGWGDLIRYIPYPVIGGFLGSIGWLMLSGGLGVSVGQAFTLSRAWTWIAGPVDARLVVGLALGIAIWRVSLRLSHPLTLPGLMLLGAGAIHAGLRWRGIDLAAARGTGWLLAPFSHTSVLQPGSPALLAAVQWGAIVQQLPLIASAVIVSTIGLLLSATSLEVAWDERVDINQDLRALGQGNLLLSLCGGLVGGISISRSVLNKAAGAVGRASGFFAGALYLLALNWGGPILALVPRPLLGGMLIYLGLGMLKTWLVDSRRRLSPVDHLTVVAMVTITALAGFLPAVCVGVLACCFGFAVSSARLDPIRRVLARSDWPARAERGAAQTLALQRAGLRLRIVELQGVLFFGSTTRLLAAVEDVLAEAARPEGLLLDFQHVGGIDSSAAQSFTRLLRVAARHGVQIEFSHLPEAVHRALRSGAVLGPGGARVHADIDAAVAAWDDAVLARLAPAPAGLEQALADWLAADAPAADLLAHFEPLSLPDGAWVFRSGDASDALYLVRLGRLAVVAVADGREILLRTVHAGSVVGEMGLFRQTPRSASVRAQGAVELLRLSKERFDRLARDQPGLAAALYRLFVLQMAGRIEQLSLQNNALAR
ncbi:MAG: SLC26A/SulP transporter family protein [Burkholderiales bacterium]|nr:cyclic nucleotide-binding domain-containing protein [Burkholderiales bacterium]MDE1928619.1 SLC26A/SulP transporter family protein [Burkholderiales bacterium]MDE2502784.1 SLC26A/SulP transporter family protein [Burkholderiales bacterium]